MVDFGNGILNMTRYRVETHAIVYLKLPTLVLAGLATWLGREQGVCKRWLLAFWLVFMTHIFVDYLTEYGTPLLQPLSDYPFGRGSIFIIDPIYTLPLFIGSIACLISQSSQRWRWNALGLTFSSLNLVWDLGMQQHVRSVARQSLPPSIANEAPLLVSTSALNSILWRIIAVDPEPYHEGWHYLLDSGL